MKILGVNHAQITVPVDEEDAARVFYMQLLGLREIPKPEVLEGRGGFWLAAGNIQIHVAVEEGFDRLSTKSHVSYEVDDLESLRKILTEKNFRLSEGAPLPGYRRFETRDPFGNRVEFMERISS